MQRVGVPYTEAEIANAKADLEAQADPDVRRTRPSRSATAARSQPRDFDGDPDRITEMDALIAYLQMLGTLVDFTTYQAERPGEPAVMAMTYEARGPVRPAGGSSTSR